ncbi:nucleotidyltransferase family protein [Rhizosphaericola mali]|uniref:Nucleotidyltransferase n=1 Tax=Rhizosphaericola mali TaxID=2545455 RepID=A0A5P2G5D5_9BACT|nr:sugar phosphate nucleotidyltransferase [Rhizosphaericola mali]QES89359.1 nucleotidyltransferase [Rhizosphaericola mali]
MQQPTLVILAAGMASRYGSLKQIQTFGPSGETIMDYAIYDAIQAGFKKVIFIIRHSFEKEFKEVFADKLKDKIEIGFVFQEMDAFLEGRVLPADRVKPFGTGHAILCCRGQIDGPFAVINADDFYGRDSFIKGYNFLTNKVSETQYASIAYNLVNTLSENGYVSRGEIETDDANHIKSITERVKIYKQEDGQIVYELNGAVIPLSEDTKVSMNFFCFDANFIELCYQQFQSFLDNRLQDISAEFFMPQVADYYIKSKMGNIEVIPTTSKWFGVTYKEDAPIVKANIDTLIANGTYPDNLWK